MPNRIEIGFKIPDARAKCRKEWLKSCGFASVRKVTIVDVYTIDKKFSSLDLTKICSFLVNPVCQRVNINSGKQGIDVGEFAYAMEIGYLPGVTDNAGTTAKHAIEDLLKTRFLGKKNVYSSQITFIQGKIFEKEAISIGQSLANPLIQRIHVKNYQKYLQDHGMEMIIPNVKLKNNLSVKLVNLKVRDKELEEIGKNGICGENKERRGPLALDLISMKEIQKYFEKLKRNPTDVELESLAQTWSEHCRHTIFANPMDKIKEGLFDKYIRGATMKITHEATRKHGSVPKHGIICASVFTDNSGAIEFDQDFLVTHKVETHNSPSAIDPFGGAITGIVGVNRDAIGFGMGAKPIVNTFGFCFAGPKLNTKIYRDAALAQPMFSPRRVMEGVVAGVNSGGNCSGIPTPQGFIYFNDSYQGKPLVFVGTVGLIPKKIGKKSSCVKRARSGDLIVMVGGRVGLDGIHGATFSSESLSSGSPSTAVQIGDPITQKKISDALVKEARDKNYYHSITDNGAGGLSCSVAEMAKECGGCLVELDKVPLKYPGLAPWQIWISESQERMTLAVPKNKWIRLYKLLKKHDAEATVIGEFTSSGRCIVKYEKKVLMDLDMNFLHYGMPVRQLKTSVYESKKDEVEIPQNLNLNKVFLQMAARPNLASFKFISKQYDHEVQGTSVLKPLQGRGQINAASCVVKPRLDSNREVALSQGFYPRFSEFDTYHMAAASIDTAVRNLVATGVDPTKIALLDNFCWCSSNESERLFQLKNAARACYDMAINYQIPFISGKDSMFNDFNGFNEHGEKIKISVLPTLLISSIGIIDDVTTTVSLDAKLPGDLIYLVGETREELAGSEYYLYWEEIMNKKLINGVVPQVDAQKNIKAYHAFFTAVKSELVASAISVGLGGLGSALLKMSLGGMLGAEISFKNISGNIDRDDFTLFSETQGRILASVAPKNKLKFEKIMKNTATTQIGEVIRSNKLLITGKQGNKIVNLDLKTLYLAYHKKLYD